MLGHCAMGIIVFQVYLFIYLMFTSQLLYDKHFDKH